MSKGLKNRQTVLEHIEDEGLEYIGDADINAAVAMLNKGDAEHVVLDRLTAWDDDYRREAEIESLAAADFEERAYGRD